jgi:hypothetical protein
MSAQQTNRPNNYANQAMQPMFSDVLAILHFYGHVSCFAVDSIGCRPFQFISRFNGVLQCEATNFCDAVGIRYGMKSLP